MEKRKKGCRSLSSYSLIKRYRWSKKRITEGVPCGEGGGRNEEDEGNWIDALGEFAPAWFSAPARNVLGTISRHKHQSKQNGKINGRLSSTFEDLGKELKSTNE